MHTTKFIVIASALGLLLLLGCASKPVQPVRSPEELLNHLHYLYDLRGIVQTEGVASFQSAALEASLSFACISAGDSLLRLDIYSPLGGTAASLRAMNGRFRLKAQNRIEAGDTADISHILATRFGLKIPFSWIVHLFTARPYIPIADSAAYQIQGRDVLFRFALSGQTQELRTRDSRPHEGWVRMDSVSTFHFAWAKFAGEIPRRVNVTAPTGALEVRFGSVERGQKFDSTLFRLE